MPYFSAKDIVKFLSFVQVYESLFQSFGMITRNEGIRGFYREKAINLSQISWPVVSSLARNIFSFTIGGVIPAVIQIVPYNGASFGFYSKFQTIFRGYSGKTSTESGKFCFKGQTSSVSFFEFKLNLIFFPTDAVESLTCGFLAGASAKTLIYPLDVLKKRLQVQGFEEGRKGFGKYVSVDSFRHCIREMWRLEGLSGFFKGYRYTSWNFRCQLRTLAVFH